MWPFASRIYDCFVPNEAKFSLVILHAPKETMPAVISRINESEPQFLYLTENFEYQPSH